MSDHTHNWIVVDWLDFPDTNRSFKFLTPFTPPTYSVNRMIALRLMCSHCGEVKTAQDFPNVQEPDPQPAEEK